LILSSKWKFVFIKGLKVAGTSMEIALANICDSECIITPITAVDELKRLNGGRAAQNYSGNRELEHSYLNRLRKLDTGHLYKAVPLLAKIYLRKIRPPEAKYYNHMGLAEVISHRGEIPSDYFIFGIERSPYHKVISWANMQLSSKVYMSGGEMRSSIDDVRSFLKEAMSGEGFKQVLNLPRYIRRDGTFGMSKVLCYENLQEEFKAIKTHLGLPADLSLPHAKKGLLSNGMEVADVFMREHIKKINAVFAMEFEAFNYKMIEG
jgi:hypothetical protein